MRLKIFHRTSYSYDAPVPYGLQQLRLTPKSRAGQRIVDWSIEVQGGQKELTFEDEHNNAVDLVRIDPGATELSITCRGEVETPQNDGILGGHGGYAPLVVVPPRNRSYPGGRRRAQDSQGRGER